MTYDESPLKTAHEIIKDLREQLAAVTKERDEMWRQLGLAGRELQRAANFYCDIGAESVADDITRLLARQPEDA